MAYAVARARTGRRNWLPTFLGAGLVVLLVALVVGIIGAIRNPVENRSGGDLSATEIADWYAANADSFEGLATSMLRVSEAAAVGDLDALGNACGIAGIETALIERAAPDDRVRDALANYLDTTDAAMTECIHGAASGDFERIAVAARLVTEALVAQQTFVAEMAPHVGLPESLPVGEGGS